MKRILGRLVRWSIVAVGLGVGAQVPGQVCQTNATDWTGASYGPLPAPMNLATHLERELSGAHEGRFHTSSPFYEAEWVFGSNMMGAMGFGQVGVADGTHEHWAGRMEPLIDRLLGKEGRAFDGMAWDTDALATLDADDEGHAAYLGYTNLVLSLHRWLNPKSRYAAQNDAITEAIVRKSKASPHGLARTYPNQVYPVDTMAGVSSVALHDAAVSSTKNAAWLASMEQHYRAEHLDAQGLLVQAESPTGAVRDGGRGSGTMLGAYFISFSHPALSADLYRAGQKHLFTSRLGFGAMREHASISRKVDIDSGPVVAGLGLSATGFALGAARAHHDERTFRELFATAWLFGAPAHVSDGEAFVTGGPLGDAIMLAMLTTREAAQWKAVPPARWSPSAAAITTALEGGAQ